MATWLVTGGSGFLGRHLLATLGDRRPELDLLALGRKLPAGWPASRFVEADLTDPAGLASALGAARPEVVLHAAGRTPPADAALIDRDNAGNTLRLLDALQRRGRPARVVLVGSAAELGPVAEEDLPVGEDHPCRPADAYGWSKLRATLAGLAARPPLEVVTARVFNPIGPGMPASQAFGRFAAALAAPGPDPVVLRVGDLDARRDFVDVRDVALALAALADRGRAGSIYHVGTGLSRRVGDGLARLIGLSGRAAVVEADAGAARRRGPRDSRADIRRIADHTGWRPAIAWEHSLADLWRQVEAPDPLRLTTLATSV